MKKFFFALASIFLAFWLLFVEQQPEQTRNAINQAAVDAVIGR
jgi:hypothetical protein